MTAPADTIADVARPYESLRLWLGTGLIAVGAALAALARPAESVPWTRGDASPVNIRSLLGGLTRPDALILLQQAASLIGAGGGEAALEAVTSLRDVQRWWP